MNVLRGAASLREWRRSVPPLTSVGFVPTMGSLHQGHLRLVERAQTVCDKVVVSIFVNPGQFSATEDFGSYPRAEERDLGMLRQRKVDAVFLPQEHDIYPNAYAVNSSTGKLERRRGVELAALTSVSAPFYTTLEGEFRPHFFRGVATVCNILFNLVAPSHVFFGQKDAQQCVVIRKMISDLQMPIEFSAVETMREANGLAMSSRNEYLTADEREKAGVLFRAMQAGLAAHSSHATNARHITSVVESVIMAEPLARVQYVRLNDPFTLEDLESTQGGALLSLAVFFGIKNTRLIDNITLPRLQ